VSGPAGKPFARYFGGCSPTDHPHSRIPQPSPHPASRKQGRTIHPRRSRRPFPRCPQEWCRPPSKNSSTSRPTIQAKRARARSSPNARLGRIAGQPAAFAAPSPAAKPRPARNASHGPIQAFQTRQATCQGPSNSSGSGPIRAGERSQDFQGPNPGPATFPPTSSRWISHRRAVGAKADHLPRPGRWRKNGDPTSPSPEPDVSQPAVAESPIEAGSHGERQSQGSRAGAARIRSGVLEPAEHRAQPLA